MIAPQPREVSTVAWQWWRRYCSDDAFDRGVRARLKRCEDFNDLMAIPAALALVRELGGASSDAVLTRKALRVALVLAHVEKDDTDRRLMRTLGWKRFYDDLKNVRDEDRPILNETRFRRVMRLDEDELPLALIRLVRLAKGTANVRNITDALWYWNDSTRRQWAFDYFAAGTASDTESNTQGEAA